MNSKQYQMTMVSEPRINVKVKPAGDEIQRLTIEIAKASARYRFNEDLRDDPTLPATQRQRARKILRTVGGQILRMKKKRKEILNERQALRRGGKT